MTGPLTLWTLGLLLFCVLAEIGQQLNFKTASMRADEGNYVSTLLRHPLLWCGIALWAVEVVAWLAVLEHAPLAVAYPIMTLTYAGMPIAGHLLLGERLSRGQQLGAGLVALGVLIVALSELKVTPT